MMEDVSNKSETTYHTQGIVTTSNALNKKPINETEQKKEKPNQLGSHLKRNLKVYTKAI